MDEEVTSSTVNKKRRRRTPFYGHHFQQQRRERWHHFSHHHRKEEQQRENYLSIGSNSRHLGYRRVIFTTAVIIMSFQFLILFSTSGLSFVIASSLPPPSTAASSSTLLPSSPSSSSSAASYLPSSAVSAALALTSSSFSPAAVASSSSNTPSVDYDDVKFDGYSEVTTVEGREGILPCGNISHPKFGGEDPILILWYRGKAGIPIFTVDARNGTSTQIPSPEFEGRAIFDATTRPPSLRIKTIFREDEERYRCRCDYRKSKTQNFLINLTVVVPLERLRILDVQTSEPVAGVIGPYDEGSTIELVCEAVGGNPTPSLRWVKDSVPVDASWTSWTPGGVTPQGIVRNKLVMSRLGRTDLLANLTCEAVNSNLTEPSSTSVTLDINLKPLEVSIIAPKARVFSAGIRSELVCRSSGSRPPAQITWWRNGNRVTMSSSSTSGGTTIPYSVFHETTSAFVMMTSSREVVEAQQQTKQSSSPYHHPLALIGNSNKYQSHQKQQGQMAHPTMSSHSSVTSSTTYNIRQTQSPDGNVSLSSLSFIPAPDDDGSTISCRVHNIHLPRSDPMEESIQLRVQYAPLVKIVLGAKIDPDSIREGMDVYFECIIQANPWVTDVTWFFDGSVLGSDPSSGIIISNQSLVLQRVKKSSRGRYWCAASNAEGRGESDEFFLRVLFSPVCRPSQKTTYGVGRNEVVSVSCEVDSDPTNVSFKWHINNSDVSAELKTFTSNGTLSIASYVAANPRSYGKLICWGENSIGRQRDPCIYNIIPASPPEGVSNCTVRNESLSQLLFSCEGGDNGGLRQIFFLEVYNQETERLHANMSSVDVPEFFVQNLPSGSKFTLNVYAANSKGRSPVSSYTASTLSPPEKQTKSLFAQETDRSSAIFTPILGVIIGGVTTLLILILLLVMAGVQVRNNRNSSFRRHHRHRSRSKGGDSSNGSGCDEDEDSSGGGGTGHRVTIADHHHHGRDFGLGFTTSSMVDLQSYNENSLKLTKNNKKNKAAILGCESVLSTTTVTGYGVGIGVGDGTATTTTQPNSNTVNRIDLNCHHHPMDGTFAIVDDAGVRGGEQDVGDEKSHLFSDLHDGHQEGGMIHFSTPFKGQRPDITYAELSLSSSSPSFPLGTGNNNNMGSESPQQHHHLGNSHQLHQHLYQTLQGRNRGSHLLHPHHHHHPHQLHPLQGHHLETSSPCSLHNNNAGSGTDYAMLDFNHPYLQQHHHSLYATMGRERSPTVSLMDGNSGSIPSPGSSTTTTTNTDHLSSSLALRRNGGQYFQQQLPSYPSPIISSSLDGSVSDTTETGGDLPLVDSLKAQQPLLYQRVNYHVMSSPNPPPFPVNSTSTTTNTPSHDLMIRRVSPSSNTASTATNHHHHNGGNSSTTLTTGHRTATPV